MILASVLFVLVAAVPNNVTYRISMPVGRALGAARAPLVTCALALSIGVAISLLMRSK